MIKHIFIATIKPGVSDDSVNNAMEQMRAMKATIPEIKSITVGRSLGWIGDTDTVTMVIDVEDRPSFDRLIKSKAHQQISANAGEVFKTDNFIFSQIEF